MRLKVHSKDFRVEWNDAIAVPPRQIKAKRVSVMQNYQWPWYFPTETLVGQEII